MKLCENGHAIANDSEKFTVLGDCVIHCHKCSNTITLKKVSVFYLFDIIDSQGVWHIYCFYPYFHCENCGALFSTYAVICQAKEESILNYETYKKVTINNKIGSKIL